MNNAGAVTFGEGSSYTSGGINDCNSILGLVAEGGPELIPVHNPVGNYLLVGKPKENKYQVHVVVSNNLAGDGTEDTRIIVAEPVRFGTFCAPIGRVAGSGLNPFSGNLTIKTAIAATAPAVSGMSYVRRYYDMTPAIPSETATATVTLFYSQQDFDDYNAQNAAALALPAGPDDAVGKGNLRITQHHGNSATGLPGSYSGWTGAGPAVVLLTPVSVSWNEVRERWEVAVSITGFSGFFAHGNTGMPLPVTLISFDARRTNGAANRLDWSTGREDEGAVFEVMRSRDGSSFQTIGTVNGNGPNSQYTFFDEAPNQGLNHYRLRMTDHTETVSFSKLVSVKHMQGAGAVIISPVPAKNEVTITNTNLTLNGQVAAVWDQQGRRVAQFKLAGRQQLYIGDWAGGIYYFRLPDGTVLKLVKE